MPHPPSKAKQARKIREAVNLTFNQMKTKTTPPATGICKTCKSLQKCRDVTDGTVGCLGYKKSKL